MSTIQSTAAGKPTAALRADFHPNWKGWAFHRCREERKAGFPAGPRQTTGNCRGKVRRVLQAQASGIPFLGDSIGDQAIANELYDSGVNMGLRRAVRFLQQGLNLLNRDQRN